MARPGLAPGGGLKPAFGSLATLSQLTPLAWSCSIRSQLGIWSKVELGTEYIDSRTEHMALGGLREPGLNPWGT